MALGLTNCRLTAIMLGRLKLRVEEALDYYHEIGEKVFPHPRKFRKGNLKILLGTRLSGRRMEQALIEASAPSLAIDGMPGRARDEAVSIAADKVHMRDPNPLSART